MFIIDFISSKRSLLLLRVMKCDEDTQAKPDSLVEPRAAMETMAADYDHFAGGLLLLCVIRSNIRHGSIITVGRIGSSLRVGVGVRPIVAAHLAIGTRCSLHSY